MEDKFTINEIIDVLSKSLDETINELGTFAKDNHHKDEHEVDEIKFSMLINIVPYQMTVINNLKKLKNKD